MYYLNWCAYCSGLAFDSDYIQHQAPIHFVWFCLVSENARKQFDIYIYIYIYKNSSANCGC